MYKNNVSFQTAQVFCGCFCNQSTTDLVPKQSQNFLTPPDGLLSSKIPLKKSLKKQQKQIPYESKIRRSFEPSSYKQIENDIKQYKYRSTLRCQKNQSKNNSNLKIPINSIIYQKSDQPSSSWINNNIVTSQMFYNNRRTLQQTKKYPQNVQSQYLQTLNQTKKAPKIIRQTDIWNVGDNKLYNSISNHDGQVEKIQQSQIEVDFFHPDQNRLQQLKKIINIKHVKQQDKYYKL